MWWWIESEQLSHFLIACPVRGTFLTYPEPRIGQVPILVVGSILFKRQCEIVGRVPVGVDAIAALLGSLLSTSDRRVLAPGCCRSRCRYRSVTCALPAVKCILDIEGYVVLQYEAESRCRGSG